MSTKTVYDVESGSAVVLLEEKQRRSWMGSWFCASVALLTTLLAVLCVCQLLRTQIVADPAKTLDFGEEHLEAPVYHKRSLKPNATDSGKPATHLQASVSDASELHWRNDVDQAFHVNGLKLQGNNLLVPKTGLYFVYSQASFTGDCKDGETVYLLLSIQRKAISYLENRPLLSSMKTVCGDAKDSKDVWFKSIYQGAVFKLEKGDLLETNISDVSKLDTASGKTFFGAFHI
ncbi:tumor necrosis factor a (TNF superfamily, member 2) [Polypterus senegalus]|uniref:tumor necrosis factor a (TNF superfamily, member 2) n=1 Tax=Polypterus senegalus TaxID=55291 RepID=UPI001963A634|nr:tumor necrosis factor a (TNF superfamily, member 2) [Polypterus senegalus]